LSFKIFYDETDFRLKGWRNCVVILKEVIGNEDKIPGDLNFIITNDETIRKINKQFLEHDYNTDVITFDDSKEKIVNGEIYISIETVKSNSINYNVSLNNELARVMVHGILHLVGYDDKSERERKLMRNMENMWIKKMEG
jgi:rRNA maturation RNase YbeY